MIILGIDPGTAITGYGLVTMRNNKIDRLCFGVIRTSPDFPLKDRLQRIYLEINSLIQKYQPQVIAIEELFFNKNVRSALAVGQARGVILLIAALTGLCLSEYSPQQIKLVVTGYGRADKEMIQERVRDLLCLPEIPKPDDAADALAIAICHALKTKAS